MTPAIEYARGKLPQSSPASGECPRIGALTHCGVREWPRPPAALKKIGIESQKAPPKDASVAFNKSRDTAIADQSQFQVLKPLLSMISHGWAICAAERASQSRTIEGSEILR